MIKKTKILSLIMAAIISSTLIGCGNISNNKTNSNSISASLSSDTVLATINGENITLEAVDKELYQGIQSLIQEYGENYESNMSKQELQNFYNARLSVLETLVEEKILLIKAKELNLIPDDKTLSSTIEEYKKNMMSSYEDEDAFLEELKSLGYDENTFNEFLKNQIIANTVIEDLIKDVSVSDNEVKKYYDDNIDDYKTGPGAYTQHILFTDEKSAKEAQEEITSGKTTFKDLFDKYKENKLTQTFPLSEDLDFVQYNEPNFDADFLKGLASAKVNTVTAPIKSSFGYHLIQVSSIVNEEKTIPFKDVKNDISQTLLQQKQYELYQNTLIQWQEDLKIEFFTDKLKIDTLEDNDSSTNKQDNNSNATKTEN